MLKLTQNKVQEWVKPESYEKTTKNKYWFHNTDLSKVEKFWKLARWFFLLIIRNSF